MIDVLAKGLGKHVDEVTVKCWYFEEGDHVTEGDDLVELATNDSTVITIPVPASGVLTEVYFDEGETVQRDDLLCVIDDKADDLDDEDDDENDENDDDEKKKDDEEDDF